MATADNLSSVIVTSGKPDSEELNNGYCSFRWLHLDHLSENDFTFPADKKVARLLLESLNNKY